MGAVVAALVLVTTLVLVGYFRQELGLRTTWRIHRSRLSALARLQGELALGEMAARISQDVNRAGGVLAGLVRSRLDAFPEELDLGPWVPAPAASLEPSWRDLRAGFAGRATSRILAHRARIRFPRACLDSLGTEEWTAILELGVTVGITDGSGSLRKEMEAAHEIRVLLLAPPRPFDQLGLYLGDASALLDLRAANLLREEAIRGHLALLDRLRSLDPAGLSAADARWLGQIVTGMVPGDELRRRLPPFPESGAAILGIDPEVQALDLAELDLESGLARIRQRIEAREAGFSAYARVDRSRLEHGYWLVDEYSNLFDRLWQVGSGVISLVDRLGGKWRDGIEPYLPRLEPGYFLARVTLRPDEQEPFFHQWRARGARLEAIVDATGFTRPVELEGELQGRVMLLVGRAGIRLRDLNWEAAQGENRLVIVSLGGDVDVEGKVAAAILMLGPQNGAHRPGRLRMAPSAHLKGSLILPWSGSADLALHGALEYDRSLHASWPPRRTLDRGTRGEYLVSVGPRPLWTREAIP